MEEIKVTKPKSSKKKIILSSVGIFLICIFLFGVSFIFSLSYLISPSPIVFGGASTSLEEENAQLKEEIETLENKIDMLEENLKTYRNSYINALDQAESKETDESEEISESSTTTQTTTTKEESKPQESSKTQSSTSSKFTAETTVTPEDHPELSEPASEDITVVEIP